MPTISQMNIPTPKSWDEFEEITLDALKSRWNTSDLFRHGRQGQPQYGVDIYGVDDLYQPIGVQCKNYGANLSLILIKDEIKIAEKFQPKISIFYFATTTPRDARLQKEVRLLSKQRVEKNKFAVGIFFWDDIIQDLIANKDSFNKHYPQFNVENKQKEYPTLIGLLDLVYYGKSFKFYMSLIFGGIGAEPLEMQAICDLIDNGSLFIKNDNSRINLRAAINNFREYVFVPLLKGEALSNGWQPANDMATSIELMISSIESLLEKEELLVYNVGEILSIWDRKINKDVLIEKASIDRFLKLLERLNLGEGYVINIKELISSELNNLDKLSNVQVPSWIYNQVRNGLIEKCIF